MNFTQIKNLEEKYYSQVFSRHPVCAVKGRGMYVWDSSGEKYLDMFAGIAVNALGHCHPAHVLAIKKQAETLIHTSNYLYTTPQLELAELLTKISGMDRVFFSNDGTEAVEAAVKLARSATGKKEVIAMKGGFHGRSMGALGLTWSEKFRHPFEPLVPGMSFVDYDNAGKLEKAITKNTAAVILEPIQGEAGVILPKDGYLKEVRKICDDNNVLMIADEVQTGFGRTGKMFACEHENVTPDIMCVAKGLGGGFPIGAALFRGIDFGRGQHGGTFVGSPLACAASKAVIETIIKDKLVENSAKTGKSLMDRLASEGMRVHGRGLMIGIDVADGKKTVLDLIEKKVLTINSENTVRVLPPLIIEKEHADIFVSKIKELKDERKI